MSDLTSPIEGRISSRYGTRTHPVTGVRSLHTGTDIAAAEGQPIRASHTGRVSTSRPDSTRGNWVGITGVDLTTYYLHLARRDVVEGQIVTRGQKIGTVGHTGTATGPHLHFETWPEGRRTDPESYFSQTSRTRYTRQPPCPALGRERLESRVRGKASEHSRPTTPALNARRLS